MKTIRLTSTLLFLLCFILLQLRTNPKLPVQAALSDKVLRLHVIANDDSVTSQEIKYQVRDAISTVLSAVPDTVSDKESALLFLQTQLPMIKHAADTVLQESGVPYRATVTIDQRYYPIKTYGHFMFPEGLYDAICVTLGEGQGQNWWCIAFPNLCFIDGSYRVTAEGEEELKLLLTDEEYEAILIQKPKLVFRFRLLEWAKEVFTGVNSTP